MRGLAAVFAQLLRLFAHRGERLRLSFWRTAAGHDVGSPKPRDAAAVEKLQGLLGDRVTRGLVVRLCEERFPLTGTVDAVPFGVF